MLLKRKALWYFFPWMEVDTTLLNWKVSFGRSFKFHSDLLFKSNETKFFLFFYREIILYWKKTSCYDDWNTFLYSFSISVVQCEYPSRQKNISQVSQLFSNNGSIEKWHKFKREYDLHQNYYFQWVQLIESYSRKIEIYD